MNNYIKTEKYDKDFLVENMMGPNSLVILEELLKDVPIKKGMRVLDLGCGKGLTSIFLAKEYDVQVFAVDLWITATENYNRFQSLGLDNSIIPVHADAHELPFANAYFDAVISVDSYHYFGNNCEYFNQYLRPLLKQDALVALAFPGMKTEILDPVPQEMKPYWPDEALATWHSPGWWKDVFSSSLSGFTISEMQCFERAWSDWLATENPYAIGDRAMMEADHGRYMNIISIVGNIV